MFYPSVYYNNNWAEKTPGDQYVEYSTNSFVNSDWKNPEQDLTQEEEEQTENWPSDCNDFPSKTNKQLLDIEGELLSQNLYKTELCRTYEDTKTCRYGSKCQFAHGRDELRPVIRHPKYKTEVCKTFYTIGTCPYGKRCRFIHTTLKMEKSKELREQSKENKAPKIKFQPSQQFPPKIEYSSLQPQPIQHEFLWSATPPVADQSLCTHLETIPISTLEPDDITQTDLSFEEENQDQDSSDSVRRLSFFQSLA